MLFSGVSFFNLLMAVFSDIEHIIARPLPLITIEDAKRILVCSALERLLPLDEAKPAALSHGIFFSCNFLLHDVSLSA